MKIEQIAESIGRKHDLKPEKIPTVALYYLSSQLGENPALKSMLQATIGIDQGEGDYGSGDYGSGDYGSGDYSS